MLLSNNVPCFWFNYYNVFISEFQTEKNDIFCLGHEIVNVPRLIYNLLWIGECTVRSLHACGEPYEKFEQNIENNKK